MQLCCQTLLVKLIDVCVIVFDVLTCCISVCYCCCSDCAVMLCEELVLLVIINEVAMSLMYTLERLWFATVNI